MAVKVVKRDYKNRYRPEIVDWLIGNVGDWQTITLEGHFAVEKKFSQSKPLMLENSGLDLVLGDGTEWNEYGFDTGDTITWKVRLTLYDDDGNPIQGFPIDLQVTRQIVLLQGDRITLNSAWLTDVNMLPYKDGSIRIDRVEIYADKKPEGAEIIYGHLTNSESDGANLHSFIDGTLTRIQAEYMHTLTGWQDCNFVGMQSGMAIRTARWRYIGKEGTHTYKYEFDIEFMLHSIFEDLTNFETMTAPSQLLGAESVTDNFQIYGYPEWNNPNTMIKSDKKATKRLGNTGWFNENFNGLDDDFTILSVEYTDVLTNTPTQRLSYGAETKVKAVIQGIPNLANGLTKLGIGFIWLPETEDFYKEKGTPYQQNLMINTAGGVNTGVFTPSATPYNNTYTGYTNIAGVRMDVRDVHFYIQGGNLVYEAIFTPTAGFSNFIDSLDEAERNYAIWISVADRTEVTNFSDRVSILLDYNTLDLYVPPVGEWQPMNIGFIEHPNDETAEPKSGQCADFMVEDDVLAVIDFKVDVTNDIPTKIEFVIEVERIADGIKYELQRYAIDLTGYPNDSAGVPQWDYDQIRGFKYEAGNNKNFVKLFRDPTNDDGNNKGYKALYGFKMRWEDWILRTGVPNDFFNAGAENNGFNNDWVQYFNNTDWDIQFTVYTYAPLNGAGVKYVNEEKFTLKDYNNNDNLIKTWEIIRESDNTNLPVTIDAITGEPLGILLENERVILRVIYEKINGNFADITKYYGTIGIEVDRGAGQFEFRQLSTIWGSEGDNPLQPLVGETRTKKTLLAPNKIKLECAVEPSLLNDAIRYKLSSRLGCEYECEEVVIDQDTKIFIYFDSSGSMNSTLAPLQEMRDTLLKDRLLPFYNNDPTLYDQNVTIVNVGDERTINMLNMLNNNPPDGNVLVMIFQDEASPIYHTNTDIDTRTQAYDNDLVVLRNRLANYDPNYYRGVVFQVSGYPIFKTFIQAIENGTAPYDGVHGLSDKTEIIFKYDITDGGTPNYYLDLIVQAMNELGFNV